MPERIATVAPQRVDGELVDGRLAVSLADPTATLAVDVADRQPLSEHEPVATLSIEGDAVSLAVDLTADDLAALADAVATAAETGDDSTGNGGVTND